jgi:hypothetical protein
MTIMPSLTHLTKLSTSSKTQNCETQNGEKENITETSSHTGICTVHENCTFKVSVLGQQTITHAQLRLLRQCHTIIVISSIKLRQCGPMPHTYLYPVSTIRR